MSASEKKLFIAIRLPKPVAGRVCQIQQDLIQRLGTASSVRLVAAEKLHMTLLFLGTVDVEAMDVVTGAFERAVGRVIAGDGGGFTGTAGDGGIEDGGEVGGAPGGPRIVLTNPGAFPTTRNPRVVWIGAHDPSGLIPELAMTLRKEIAASNCVNLTEKATSAFVPHITIAYPHRHISREQRHSLSVTLKEMQTGMEEDLTGLRAGRSATRNGAQEGPQQPADRQAHIGGDRAERIAVMESIATPSGSRYVERRGIDL
ncbi:MAG: hypothetical protein PF508_19720 [Spirochaeta sp.]|jgi:2'-5' RNA ligase|nr:hypothetical protein [Spirochaeta sp.]